jgi:beta-propeller repeat-containing protein
MKTERLLPALAISLALTVASSAKAQIPSFQWARRVASTVNPDNELSIGLAIDRAANVYVTGWFDGTNDFGGIILTNKGGQGQDIFVAKYNSSGSLEWAQRAGGATPDWDTGRGVGLDINGNVYLTGGFRGDADFGTNVVSAPVDTEFFLAKYNSAGTCEWVRQSDGGRDAYGTGLAVDGAGNCYAVGSANSGVTLNFGTTNLTIPSFGVEVTFLVKYSSTGTNQWAQFLGGPGSTYATKVAVDAFGYVYVHGTFRANATIGTTNLTSLGQRDLFVAKFDTSGALIWARQEGGTGDDGGEGGVAVDQTGDVYVSGPFGSNPLCFIGGTCLTNAGGLDAFVAKYSSSGLLQWARRAGGTNLDIYWDIALDNQGNPHLAGALGYSSVAPSGSGGVTAAKYDSSGNFQWARSADGAPGDPVGSIAAKCAADWQGDLYLAGWYQTLTTFGTNVLQPKGYWNYFVAKLGFARPVLGIQRSNSVVRLSVSGEISNRFVLEYVSALAASNTWQSMVTSTIASSPVILTDTNTAGNSNRFYRAKLIP